MGRRMEKIRRENAWEIRMKEQEEKEKQKQ